MNDISLDSILELVPDAHPYERYFAMRCLWHQDNKPSMFVYADGFRCSACGVRGPLSLLRTKLTGYEPVANTKPRNGSKWSSWLYDGVETLVRESSMFLKRNMDLSIYLTKRGITKQSILNLHIGFQDGFYFFPVRNESGDTVSVIARAGEVEQAHSGIRYLLPPKHEPCLYAPDWKQIHRADVVYVVFGILDAVTLYQHGYPVITGTNGKHINPSLFDDIRKPIVILPDFGEEPDAASLASSLGWRGKVKKLSYPLDCKDPNDVARKHNLNLLMA